MGFVKLNAIRHVGNLGAYVAQYCHVDLIDKRLNGRRCYFCSRGLFRPMEIVGNSEVSKRQIEQIVSTSKLNLVYENKFLTDEFGVIVYKQYASNT